MEFKNVFVKLKTTNLLRLPLNQIQKEITIDPIDEFQNPDVTLICYKIQLITNNTEVFAYLFKNVNPAGIWYDKNVRDGDRLITLNGQDVTHLSYENIYSSIMENKLSLTCKVVWHPELFIDLETSTIQSDTLKEFSDSKTLMGVNIHKQLTDILHYLFNFHPQEPYQLFERLVANTSFEKGTELTMDNIKESNLFIQRQLQLLSNPSTIQTNPEETMTNILELDFLFEQVGVGLNKDEIYWIWVLMKALLNDKPNIQKLRFWGKIFGIKNNYYIVEADFDTFDDVDLTDSEFIKYQDMSSSEEEKIPPEPIGDGVNQKVFYVSTGIDQTFIQLPMVTPQQIELSRRIQQFFTGDLDAPILFELHFPGVEKHLLRAQIQRITAGTQIGPKHYFKISIDDEEEIDEEIIDSHQIKFDINTEFEGNRLEDLVLPHGQYWVHYVAYIYEQGRNVHFNPAIRTIPAEHSPNLLSPVNEDSAVHGLYPAWSIGLASRLVPEHSLVYARSNRWPGAFTVGDRHRFKNIYIGWGVKNFLESHQANMINILPEKEYDLQVIETNDPTIEEEDNELFKSAVLLSPHEDEEFE
ncbi:unnamed protein product [Rotaria socialis]|uniref:Uncharacterized protein n=1 Tax=Rotaria socialis TaxID=392032 RepID=A0A820ULQ5_9BILA|nr:unnamed protein product [Rotaria socialis]CAF3209116.1 unnamed protein product [Rotaria socialis]CAF4408097.1 unnamed protein product [Rotaria socialis]CAF4486855.1 unnamed protein product [Rotaria socialis]